MQLIWISFYSGNERLTNGGFFIEEGIQIKHKSAGSSELIQNNKGLTIFKPTEITEKTIFEVIQFLYQPLSLHKFVKSLNKEDTYTFVLMNFEGEWGSQEWQNNLFEFIKENLPDVFNSYDFEESIFNFEKPKKTLTEKFLCATL